METDGGTELKPPAKPHEIEAGYTGAESVPEVQESRPTHRQKVGALIAGAIILIFAISMLMAEWCALYCTGCDLNGVETMNLVGHIFGPLLGVIVAFYFAEDLKRHG